MREGNLPILVFRRVFMTAKIIRFERRDLAQKSNKHSNETIECLNAFSEELKSLTKRNREMTARLKTSRLNN